MHAGAYMTIRIDHLTIGYEGHAVQTDLNLGIEPGQMICLLGQNGCGKSTLMKTLAGFLPALSGEALMDNESLLSMLERERAKRVSVVLTERISADHTTVADVVAMGRYPYASFLGGMTKEDHELIDRALGEVEMMHKKDAYFNQLSDGERQRSLIAKALAQQTPLILLDEPTAHLDLPSRIKTLLLLRRLAHETGRSVVISTHELDLAMQTADTIWLMTPGKGVAVGSPKQLTENGAFQAAFQDEHFRFVSENGELRIEILHSDPSLI